MRGIPRLAEQLSDSQEILHRAIQLVTRFFLCNDLAFYSQAPIHIVAPAWRTSLQICDFTFLNKISCLNRVNKCDLFAIDKFLLSSCR